MILYPTATMLSTTSKISSIKLLLQSSFVFDNIFNHSLTGNLVHNIFFSHFQIHFSWTDFLVDIGSAVGLWFGISVFGLADIGIVMFDYIKEGVFMKFCLK